jgi:DNA (cytosine-5)-methyltransferase 1
MFTEIGKIKVKYEHYSIEDVKKSSARELFTVVSTFAGGGGSSTGYRLAGGKVIAINEFVEEAIKTYSTNFPDTKIIPGDIKKLKGKNFLEVANLEEGELDILDGSPPCSAFSVAGKREKNWKGAVHYESESYFDFDTGEMISVGGGYEVKDGVKKYSDDQVVEAIEDLFLEFIRIAKDIKPKVIIAENVKGITMGKARDKLHEFQNEFEKIKPGYLVTHHVLNAADYGVPQARERLFFVCVRQDVADVVGLNFLNMNTMTYPQPTTPKHISIKSAIDNVENDPAEEKELLDFVEGSFQKKFIELLPFNPTKHTKPSDPEFRDKNPKGSCFNMIRPAINLPSPTLTQAGQQKGVSGVFHYAKNRKLTIKELKILMSIPDDYVLTGKFDQQAERLGRMVAPKMMAALSSHVYENILKPYKESL